MRLTNAVEWDSLKTDLGQTRNGKTYGQKLGQDRADLEFSEMTEHYKPNL